PPVDAEAPQPRRRPAPFRGDLPVDRALLADRFGDARRNADENSRLRRLPDRTVGGAVPGVDELAAQLPPDRLELRLALEVATILGGEHLVEKAQMRGHALGDRAVRRGGEDDAPPLLLLAAQVADHRLPV